MDTEGDDFSEDTISTKLELNQNIINVSVDQLATLDKQVCRYYLKLYFNDCFFVAID